MKSSLDHAAAVSAGHIDEATRAWLQIAFSQWLAGETLENALRLDRASLIRQRNQWLLEAARLLDDGSGTWRQAGRLAAAIRRYQNRVAPLVRRDPFYPLGDIDRALCRAFSAGRPPTSQRKLYDFLR